MSGPGKEVATTTSSRSAAGGLANRVATKRCVLHGSKGIAQRVHAFHTEPSTLRNALQADAVCVVRRVAAIAKEQNLLMVCEVAYWARCRDFVV